MSHFYSHGTTVANFKSLIFHPCHEHIRKPLCKNLLISKNINKVTHTFLWNANFGGNFFLTDLKIFFNLSFLSVHQPRPYKTQWLLPQVVQLFVHHKIWTSHLCHLYIAWPNDAQCSHQHNTHLKQLAKVTDFWLEQCIMHSRTQSRQVA
jgi:hypothetical protein